MLSQKILKFKFTNVLFQSGFLKKPTFSPLSRHTISCSMFKCHSRVSFDSTIPVVMHSRNPGKRTAAGKTACCRRCFSCPVNEIKRIWRRASPRVALAVSTSPRHSDLSIDRPLAGCSPSQRARGWNPSSLDWDWTVMIRNNEEVSDAGEGRKRGRDLGFSLVSTLY